MEPTDRAAVVVADFGWSDVGSWASMAELGEDAGDGNVIDGDVLLHAIASAILGAAGLGDLGGMFPSSDQRYANYDSTQFVKESARQALKAGWLVDHVDATIIAQRPRLASELPRMMEQLGAVEGIASSSINIKVTSTDHVGAIGNGEGIAAQAVVTLVPATA